MHYSIQSQDLDQLSSDCLIVGIYEKQLTPAAKIIDQQQQGLISKLLATGDLNGKNGTTLLLHFADTSIPRILLVGLGAADNLHGKNYRKALVAAFDSVKDLPINSLLCALGQSEVAARDDSWKIRQIVEIAEQQLYKYQHSKSIKPPLSSIKTIDIIAAGNPANQLGLQQGIAIAAGVSLAKSIGDLPGNICTPTYLAKTASQIASNSDKMTAQILQQGDIEKLGMACFLSVGRGSRQPPKLIVLHYNGGVAGDKPVVLVGKGITFDAGGISLKPSAAMDEMKYDMCGAASVLGALQAASAMQLPINIVAVIPTCENMPDGDANKPGDVVTTMSGLTVEILNTDAEGRLILCDALTFAKQFKPKVVIDVATLTGAVIVALGRVPNGLLGNDDDLCASLADASNTACDSLWRLPLWDEYHELLESNFADLANIGGREAGTITAACFLSRFTESYPWAHLDIAATAWRTGKSKGATGRPVPLLVQYLIDTADAAS